MDLTLLDSYPDAGNFPPLLIFLLLAAVAIVASILTMRYLRSRRR